jgi:hypothetical protein
MAEEKKEVPKGADFTLIVPLDRKKTNSATFHIKELTEDVYLAAMSLIDKDKDLDATRLIIKSLHVGGDDPSLLNNNLIASLAARKLVREIMAPLDGELKKN